MTLWLCVMLLYFLSVHRLACGLLGPNRARPPPLL